MTTVTVRRVETEEERAALYRFRYDVYVEEFGMTTEADHERRWLRDAYDDDAVSYGLFGDGGIVGSLRCTYLSDLPDPAPLIDKFIMQPSIDRFGIAAALTTSRFILAPHLRHGRAIFRLMQAAHEDAVVRGARLNYGDCSPHLLPFYEQMGYRRYSSGFNDTAFGYKLPILMLVRDRAHMQSVRSPLARLIAEDHDDAEARGWFAETYPDFVAPMSTTFLDNEAYLELLAERVSGEPAHHIALMRGLTREEANRFVAASSVIALQPGDHVIRSGDRENTVFAMLSGLAEVRTVPPPAPPIRILGAGDTFGEIGFLNGVARTADVTASTPGEVLVLSGDSFDRLLRQEPVIAAKVLRNLASELALRLTETTRQVGR
ncbi:MAG: cyclic nucleotide-binding domain-containing protein [Alphaproteobacteria bacterium]